MYTLVQHSAFAAKGDPQFERALESAFITDRQVDSIRRDGGLIFDDYNAAEDAVDALCFPEGSTAIVPYLPPEAGSFHPKRKVGGRALFVGHEPGTLGHYVANHPVLGASTDA